MRLFSGLVFQLFSVVDNSTIGNKIVETLYSNGVTSENKRIHTPPLSSPLKVGVFVVFYRELEHGTTFHGGDGGRKAILIFPPFEVSKMYKSPFCHWL